MQRWRSIVNSLFGKTALERNWDSNVSSGALRMLFAARLIVELVICFDVALHVHAKFAAQCRHILLPVDPWSHYHCNQQLLKPVTRKKRSLQYGYDIAPITNFADVLAPVFGAPLWFITMMLDLWQNQAHLHIADMWNHACGMKLLTSTVYSHLHTSLMEK